MKRALGFSVVSGVLLFILLHWWGSGDQSMVDIGKERRAAMEQLLKTLAEKTYNESVNSYANISYHVKDSVASQLAQETCECRGEDEGPGLLPFSDLLFPRVWAHNLQRAYLGNHKDPEGVKSCQAREYEHFKRRAYTSSDLLVVAEANSPLQYPTQGVEVGPLKTIVIPGLALKESPGSRHVVKLTAALGVFDVAATVDGVTIKGAGEKSMEMSSAALSSLNRQLQFVTYTNTQFHPRTADTVTFASGGHRAVFTIKVGHAVVPKLYNAAAVSSGGEYDISSLVTIATKTFLRYDKLRDLIASVRRYYPTVTIVVADDNERPQPVTGPHIEHYTMPFGKGWFAGRNLAVSQVTTKYVLWVDDDFIFTAETKLEKMVDVLERTTLDLVAGAVREASGYAATYRHVISTEEGGAEGDCLRIRRGHHHAVDGFPNCVVTDATINFFMARTDKVREPGFDPRLARSGHLEFFVDALGSLHVGSCDDVVVGHASKIRLPWSKMTSDEEAYERFRYSGAGADRGKADEAGFYIKNRFQCMSSVS